MHLCLSCNQPCNLSSIFCESCRLALLERRTDEQLEEELPQMVKAGAGEGPANVVSLPPAERDGIPPQAETDRNMPVQQTDEKFLWSWNTTGFAPLEKAHEHSPLQSDTLVIQSSQQAQPVHQTMPKRVRQALIIFVIVGVLALSVDGVLLVFSIARHHGSTGAGTSPTQGTHTGQTSTMSPDQTATAGSSGTTPTALNTSFILSTSHVLFTTQASAHPAPQEVRLQNNGQQNFSWQLTPTAPVPDWLMLSALQGTTTPGARSLVRITVQPAGIAPGTYVATFQVVVSGEQNDVLAGNPPTLDVTLTVLTPCVLIVSPGELTFRSTLLQPTPSAQKLSLMHSGDCALPINWSISSSASWITFQNASGIDNGNGNIVTVNAKNPGKIAGTETATLTLQATDAQNVLLPIEPATVRVTITVGL